MNGWLQAFLNTPGPFRDPSGHEGSDSLPTSLETKNNLAQCKKLEVQVTKE